MSKPDDAFVEFVESFTKPFSDLFRPMTELVTTVAEALSKPPSRDDFVLVPPPREESDDA